MPPDCRVESPARDERRSRASKREAGFRILAFAWMLIVWESYAIVSWTPTNLDGSGRLKGRDFPQFYAMGGLVREGRAESLSDGRALSEWAQTKIPDAPRFRLQNVYGPQIAL